MGYKEDSTIYWYGRVLITLIWSKGQLYPNDHQFLTASFFNIIFLEGVFIMLREFVSLVNETVNQGCERGAQIFLENIERDLHKTKYLTEYGPDAILSTMFEQGGYNENEVDDVDEEALDAALAELESEE